MSDSLVTYLHDHLGGAKAAVDLLRALQDRQKDQPLGALLADLLTEIEADRATLQQLADKIGGGPNVLKELTGWASEKGARLKLLHTQSDEFALFETLEFLALGVLGKMGMWQALDVVALSEARLRGYDFKQLAQRAEQQYAQLEHERLASAGTALQPIA
jgi:hypothetical protein